MAAAQVPGDCQQQQELRENQKTENAGLAGSCCGRFLWLLQAAASSLAVSSPEMCSFIVLRPEYKMRVSARPRVLRSCRGGSSLAFLVCGGRHQSSGSLTVGPSLQSLPLSSRSCPCVSSLFVRAPVIRLRPTLIQYDFILITSAKILFPNKPTCAGTRH